MYIFLEIYVLDSVSTSISKPLFISINSSLTIICHKMLDVWFPNQIWRTINVGAYLYRYIYTYIHM